jgi:MerR family transcriptional regulator, repressor of the yfmOP operon
MSTTYRIGEVSERVGITTRTIRYYEELGLLGGAPGDRSKGTHRLYDDDDVSRLTELLRLRDLLGLTLEELTALAETGQARAALRDEWAETATDEERAAIVERAFPLVERQLELVRGRIEKLAEFARELEGKLEQLAAERRKLR